MFRIHDQSAQGRTHLYVSLIIGSISTQYPVQNCHVISIWSSSQACTSHGEFLCIVFYHLILKFLIENGFIGKVSTDFMFFNILFTSPLSNLSIIGGVGGGVNSADFI